jgi:hypothetical protein
MVWAKNGTPTTLGSAGDDMDITDLTETKFKQFLIHLIPTGDASLDMTLNNDSGSDYARRTSFDGGSDGTDTSATKLDIGFGNAHDKFYVHYWVDISGEETLGISFVCNRNTAGAGTAPRRGEQVLKYTDTSAQVTRVDCNNSLSGSYDTDSNISALGTD